MDIIDQTTKPAQSFETIARWRYAWVSGILFVLALLAESGVALGVGVNQNDSATTIATALDDHRTRLLVITPFRSSMRSCSSSTCGSSATY
jgi:hypothetical protein